MYKFGGDGKGETPVPIPNTAVKPLSADGTARETVWESRTPPKFFIKTPLSDLSDSYRRRSDNGVFAFGRRVFPVL